jgi:long-chain acyl-CoA synthetase
MEDHVRATQLGTLPMAGVDIPGRLARAAALAGDRVALLQDSIAISYPQLLAAIELMGQRLATLGLVPGATFAVLAQNRPEILVAYYAAARYGYVYVPLNPALTAREVAHVIRHSRARLLLHEQEFDAVAVAACETICRVEFGQLPRVPPLRSLRAANSHDGDFLIIYTSGSTGTPKAVVFGQAAEVGGNDSLIRMWGIGPKDRTLVALPLGFLYGLSTAAATALQAGGSMILLRRFHPKDALEALVRHKVSVFHGVPTMFAMMLDYSEATGQRFDLSFIRQLVSAGAPLNEDLRQRFEQRFSRRIDDYYALTEARPIFGRFHDDPRPVPRGSLGREAPGVRARILAVGGSDVAAGEVGELAVHAPGMFTRYDGDPDLTAQVLVGGEFRTGDLARRDVDGNYFLTGRIKDIIIRGGSNVAPAEVEEVLLSHPEVSMAAVVGAANATFGEIVIAFVVPRAQQQPDPAALLAHCAGRLASFKVPARIHVLDELPLGLTGKVNKQKLKALAEGAG